MKLLKKALLGVAVAAAMGTSAQAGVVALSNMNVFLLGFVSPGETQPTLVVGTDESRTGNASADYNGITAVGAGPGSETQAGAVTVDIGYRCAGDCVGAAGLYNGTLGGLENATNHIAVPGGANYALGDMKISGEALGGSVVGLTRADAVSTGPTNKGGANSTIKNGGSITGTFFSETTFTGSIVLGVDAYLQTWIDPLNSSTEKAIADAGYGWNMTVKGLGVNLTFAPSELNKSMFSNKSSNNDFFSWNSLVDGLFYSAAATYTAGEEYTFSINQSSNAAIRDIPEPESLALVGLGLLGLAASRRRKAA